MTKTKITLVVAVVIVALSFFVIKNTKPKTTIVSINGINLKTEIADTEAKREKGLSFRKSIKSDEAMIFVFPYPGQYGFWMKDMSFDIDIAWIDINKKIIHIEKEASHLSYPKIFYSAEPSLYVIETDKNFFESNNIKIGDIVNFDL